MLLFEPAFPRYKLYNKAGITCSLSCARYILQPLACKVCKVVFETTRQRLLHYGSDEHAVTAVEVAEKVAKKAAKKVAEKAKKEAERAKKEAKQGAERIAIEALRARVGPALVANTAIPSPIPAPSQAKAPIPPRPQVGIRRSLCSVEAACEADDQFGHCWTAGSDPSGIHLPRLQLGRQEHHRPGKAHGGQGAHRANYSRPGPAAGPAEGQAAGAKEDRTAGQSGCRLDHCLAALHHFQSTHQREYSSPAPLPFSGIPDRLDCTHLVCKHNSRISPYRSTSATSATPSALEAS